MPARFRSLSLALFGSALLLFSVGRAQQPATNAPPSSPSQAPTDASIKLMTEAVKLMNANDTDGALNKLTEALKINPHSSGAYVLRASIYCQKKLWTQAEDDFKAAQAIAPTNVVIKFNLMEVKFLQKQYDLARPGFVALESDPDMGDLAKYKVFLCDLFGGHDAVAAQELADFNKVGGNPSYYFSNAAWDLYHKNIEDARGWLVSASHIYAARKNTYYAQSLRDLGYLPIPPPATPQ